MLRPQVSGAVWAMAFQDARQLDLTDECLVLAVPSTVAKERIEARYLSLVHDALADAGLPPYEVELRVDESAAATVVDLPPFEAAGGLDLHRAADDLLGSLGPARADGDVPLAPGAPAERAVLETDGDLRTPRLQRDRVNPRYTFDAFVTGSSNRFSHAAAFKVAETPGLSYNPLFIYGESGLGKTHLLHAIANYVRTHYPTYRVRYVSTETFLNQFVHSIRSGTADEFKRRYREIEVLLVDDIQFMEGKEQLQEEFFHTFNQLHESGNQIVLSSDRPPDAISTLEVRLRSRFKMGLITDIQPPELETRLAILGKKAEQESVHIPDDVLEFIATNITANIRELEGALNRVAAFSTLNDEPLSAALAERVLAPVLGEREQRAITPATILEATAAMFDFSVDDIRGQSRRRPLVTARQIGMYACRELTDLSYPAIAEVFGGRDHTTVIHAVRKIETLMKERRQIYDQVTELIETIKAGE
ncbi:MAG: chromosomal replication initiator protein DnaA [Acidimicrobiales bacterium]|nr:chromosomal replication initiator protein DnaA [Acidimicrobiales bacterium]